MQTLPAIRAEVSLCLQVVDLLRYFSWAEPQLKAMKALQHVSDSPSPLCKVTMFHSHFTQSRPNCGLYQKANLKSHYTLICQITMLENLPGYETVLLLNPLWALTGKLRDCTHCKAQSWDFDPYDSDLAASPIVHHCRLKEAMP